MTFAISRRSVALITLAFALLFASAPGAARGRAAAPDPPALTHLVIDGDVVRASTEADSTGQCSWVSYDPKTRRWSAPTPGPAAALSLEDSLASVRVFDGGLFDKFRGDTIALGDGTSIARRDSGFALLAGDTDLGWPSVTEKDVLSWAGKVRQGLPRDYPEERVHDLLDRHRLYNVPGPTTHAGNIRWFGLKGGFVGGQGQLGGLVSYDPDRKRFDVHRHYLLVDASVTRLFARGGGLWIGTGRFGERALEGITGLLLYRPKRGEWRQFSTRNSRISGDLIWDIAEGRDDLWVTTDRGVSRYGFDSKNWSSWYWHRTKDGAGWILSSDPPGSLAEELGR
ncbi:MAG: hypothetical protein ABI960_04025 [Candidatus Eisenbacteria bacterium]